MGFVSIASAVAIALFLGLLAVWQRRRQVMGAKKYRLRYIQLLAKLDRVTGQLTEYEGIFRKFKNPLLLDYYESTLRIFETLLEALKQVPPFATDPKELDAAYFLALDCSDRASRIDQGLKELSSGRPFDGSLLEPPRTEKKTLAPLGCYFCSRPFVEDRFSQVRVRIEDEVRQVTACRVCQEELETTKKIKVLYFMKDGKPVHWSKIADYVPAEDFWNLNQRQPVRKSRHLELVTSQHPELDDDKGTNT